MMITILLLIVMIFGQRSFLSLRQRRREENEDKKKGKMCRIGRLAILEMEFDNFLISIE